MIQIESVIEINAPQELVWEVITDFSSYPEWSNFKGEIKGEARRGAFLKVIARPRPRKLKITFFRVTVVVPEQELRWIATYAPFFLLRGERYWIIERVRRDVTRVIQGEAFFGLIEPLLRRKIERDGPKGMENLCRSLKEYVEEKAGHQS